MNKNTVTDGSDVFLLLKSFFLFTTFCVFNKQSHREISLFQLLFSTVELKKKPALGRHLIFKRFHWIPAPSLHTEDGFLSRRGLWTSWPPHCPAFHNTLCSSTQPPNRPITSPCLLRTSTLYLHALFIFHNMNITNKSASVSQSLD